MTHRVRAVFADPARADKNLKALADACIAAGTRVTGEELVAAVEAYLAGSPDPDAALNNLVRFSEESLNKASLFNDLVAYPVLLDVLLKLFAFSAWFADILVRDPELFRWLTASDSLLRARTREYYDAEVSRSFDTFQNPEKRLNALRRLARREILRIGARDILGDADLPVITHELSLLADALIHASCVVGEQQLTGQFPAKPDAPYAVIGLGKLGGGELNYSSDVDLLFVYAREGEMEDARGKRVTYHEYFNKLCERTVQNISTATSEGHLYRVDMRLRPESGAGPLARSLNSFMLYYESRGELWERQMLIKARTVGGDTQLGAEFIRQLEPFVYPRTLFERPEESISRIKARIESAIEGEENVKLRAGGIRDIEFVVQALQLINGGRLKEIRRNNTRDAIASLSAAGLLNRREAATLADAYVFLRTIEHRLQMTLNTQTHKLPDDQHALTSLARRVGLTSSAKLVKEYTRHTGGVREIFDQVLAVRADPPGGDLAAIAEGGLSDSSMKHILAAHGFQNPAKGVQYLKSLTRGSLLAERQDLDGRGRQAFREVAPLLFADIPKTPSPDLTLRNLAHLAPSQRLPEAFYNQMKEQGFRNLVLKLCSVSPRIIKGLALRPGLFEEVAVGIERPLPLERITSRTDIVEYRITHELRECIRHVLGLTEFTEFTAGLSTLADALVDHVLRFETKSAALKSPALAIFALGKFGTREISLDADLDLLFLVQTKSATEKNRMEKLAQKITTRLSASGERGKGYDVDARLRPEGKSAPLVVETSAFLHYLHNRASLWERQSLTRLRHVCGSPKIGGRILDEVKSFVYDSPLPAHWVDEVVAMRRRMETHSRTRATAYTDLKHGAGGMVDVEFLVQMQLLAARQAGRALHALPTCAALEQIPEARLHKQDGQTLARAYALYRRVELLKRLTVEEHGSLLPEGEHLELLGRIQEGIPGEQLKADIESTMRTVRNIFLVTAGNLKENRVS